jgi:hypothetical protein
VAESLWLWARVFLNARYRSVHGCEETNNNATRAVSVAVRQYANGVNKGTLSANVAKVEAKEKELAAAKAAAKVLAFLPSHHPTHHSSACALLPAGLLCERNGGEEWASLREKWGRGVGLALVRWKAKV